jgi:nitrate reductase gamma subunit
MQVNATAFLVGGVLPYVALAAFVGGMAYRFRVWAKTPQPAKMTLYPWPQGSMLRDLVAEALFFPGLFKGDRVLWAMSWVFHASLALVFLGHLRVVTGAVDSVLLALGMSRDGIGAMSTLAGGAAGVVMAATLALLLLRRFAVRRAREITLPGDYLALLLVLAVVASGDAMRFGAHFDLEATRVWAVSLLTFQPKVPDNQAFLLHAALAQVLIVYIPFSKILHWGGIFFTQALVHRR